MSDEALFDWVLEAGFVFVTNNWSDFRPLVVGADVHPGLIVILENAPRAEEIAYFRAGLALTGFDMVNVVIEVDGAGRATRYMLPRLE